MEKLSGNASDYGKSLRKLGEGAYASVYATDKDFAIKICKNYSNSIGYSPTMLTESSIISYLDHPNIMKPKTISTTYSDLQAVKQCSHKIARLGIVFEKMTMNLETYISIADSFNIDLLKSYVLQIVYGMLHYTNYDIFHGDLKPDNLLIDKHGNIKITDFGISGFIAHHPDLVLSYEVASFNYRPPEIIFNDINFTSQVDVWALGCIIYRMFTRKYLFDGKNINQLKKRICETVGFPSYEEYPSIYREMEDHRFYSTYDKTNSTPLMEKLKNENFPEDLIDLLSKMLVFNPANRITVEEILNHPFLTKYHAIVINTIPIRLTAFQSLELREVLPVSIHDNFSESVGIVLTSFEERIQKENIDFGPLTVKHRMKFAMLSHILTLLVLSKDHNVPINKTVINGVMAMVFIIYGFKLIKYGEVGSKIKEIISLITERFNWRIFPTTIYEYYLAMEIKDLPNFRHEQITQRIMNYYLTPERLKESASLLALEAIYS